ncbi:MAG: spore coat protein, partial [Bacillota bacterium]
MLQEKAMVNDALSAVKSELTFYTSAISECENQNLRSTIQQIRNNCETS